MELHTLNTLSKHDTQNKDRDYRKTLLRKTHNVHRRRETYTLSSLHWMDEIRVEG